MLLKIVFQNSCIDLYQTVGTCIEVRPRCIAAPQWHSVYYNGILFTTINFWNSFVLMNDKIIHHSSLNIHHSTF